MQLLLFVGAFTLIATLSSQAPHVSIRFVPRHGTRPYI